MRGVRRRVKEDKGEMMLRREEYVEKGARVKGRGKGRLGRRELRTNRKGGVVR